VTIAGPDVLDETVDAVVDPGMVVAPAVIGDADIVERSVVTSAVAEVADAPRPSAWSEPPHAAVIIPTHTQAIAMPPRRPRLASTIAPPRERDTSAVRLSRCLGFVRPLASTVWSCGDIV
jgi:hypothetical protein